MAILFTILISISTLSGGNLPDSLLQDTDSEELLLLFYNNLEGEEEVEEEEVESFLEQYHSLRETPVNINGDHLQQLSELGILDELQINQIIQYRRSYGDFLFPEELTMVDGLSPPLIQLIIPIIYVGQSTQDSIQNRITVKKIVNRSKHQITLNTGRKWDDGSHYTDDDALLLDKPGNYYLGSPWKLQVKYRYQYGDKLQCGFVTENDAGEPFLIHQFNDTIRQCILSRKHSGFDSYGVYLYAKDLHIGPEVQHGRGFSIKDLVLGDYQLSFGQGLTLWSGMSMGKVATSSSLMKRGAGVRPKASGGEGRFFRGAATTIRYNDFYLSFFYSLRKMDATIAAIDSSGAVTQVSALQETGYHRCINEIQKRNTLTQRIGGGHLSYSTAHLEIGYTLYHYQLGAYLCPDEQVYNGYYFRGDRLTDMGIDFKVIYDKIGIYGELSRSSNAAYASVIGATWKPSGYANFSILYRNYAKDYWSFYDAAVGESSRRQGEQGFYLGLHAAPLPYWDCKFYYDLFRLTWLSMQVYTPSWGHDIGLTIDHDISKTATLQLKIKTKKKMKNSSNDQVFSHYPIFYNRTNFHCGIKYQTAPGWVFSDKVEYVSYCKEEGNESQGGCLSHTMSYKSKSSPFSISIVYALFSSDDYDSRISTYENDVLGGFGISTLSGKGLRLYLLGQYKAWNRISLYAKIGTTLHLQDGIPIRFQEGSLKIDFKGEMIWKI